MAYWAQNNYGYNSLQTKISIIKDKYPNLSQEKIKDLLSRHNNDLLDTLKFIDLKIKQQQKEEEEVADFFMGLLALSMAGNAQNSLKHKIGVIKQKYPMLSEETIKDILGQHNNDVNDSLKFIGFIVAEQERKRKEEEQKEKEEALNFFKGMIGLAVVEQAGFCAATNNNRLAVIKRLLQIQPKGSTALRDAVILGVVHMLKVKQILLELELLKHKFIHIVLTDGDDTSSKNSTQDIKGFFTKLGNNLGDLCTTYFIGVGLNNAAKRGLQDLANLGGKSCELFNCNDVEIGDVFEKISVDIGIHQQIVAMQQGGILFAAEKNQLQLRLRRNNFLVLFTLDMSASMSGDRWKKVVAAVAGFMTELEEDDIIGCILFNQQPVLITD